MVKTTFVHLSKQKPQTGLGYVMLTWPGLISDQFQPILFPRAPVNFFGHAWSAHLYFHPIRYVRFGFDNEFVNRGLPVLEPARGLDPCC